MTAGIIGSRAPSIDQARTSQADAGSRCTCTHCSRTFTDRFDKAGRLVESGDRALSEHESICLSNPANNHQCQHCGKAFKDIHGLKGTLVSSGAGLLRDHVHKCEANPSNIFRCRYCYEVFVNEFDKRCCLVSDAASVLKEHAKMCSENPANQFECNLCGEAFTNRFDLRGGLASDAELVRDFHQSTCTGRRKGNTQRAARAGRRQSQEANLRHILGRLSKRPIHGDDHETLVQRTMQEIHQRVAELQGEPLKKYLREIQLRWHPDKNGGKVAESTEIFLLIQRYWEMHFK